MSNNKLMFMLLILLFIPSKSFYIYFLIVIGIFLSIGVMTNKFLINKYSRFSLILIIIILLSSTIRFFYFFDANYRDFFEIVRFIPMLLIFSTIYLWENFKYKNLLKVSFIYVLIDGIVTFLQFFKINPLGILNVIKILYNSEHHYANAYTIANRTLGLSAGPAQHASTILMFFIIFLVSLLLSKENRSISFIGMVISFLIILAAQSRTTLVALLAIMVFTFIYLSIFSNFKTKVSLFLTAAFFWVVYRIISPLLNDNFKYLNTLFLKGTEDNSFIARENKWASIFELMSQNKMMSIIGYGKEYFGEVSGRMDSELLFVFAVYGIAFTGIMIITLIKFIFNTFKKSFGIIYYPYRVSVFFIIFASIIISYPSSFFIEPKIMTIFIIIICLFEYEKVRLDYKENNLVKS